MAPVITPEITSHTQWISQMNVDVEPTAGRKTTIIGTIGIVFFDMMGA
jgi:pyruvate kinase